jgi:hypothetical protein
MSKGQITKKTEKKKPQRTKAEKKAAKRAKQEEKNRQGLIQ